MFTGIVEELGTVLAVEADGGQARLSVGCRDVVGDVAVGDSVAVNGCCVTVTALLDDDNAASGFAADLMAETLRATALGGLSPGDDVNLERAMAATSRFGGHLVQGHVDAVGSLVERTDAQGSVVLTFAAPADLAPYLVAKGSVTVDGISLTVIDVEPADEGARFRVGVIPHTLAVTTLGGRAVGDAVNLEVDLVAKYVERLLGTGVATPYASQEG